MGKDGNYSVVLFHSTSGAIRGEKVARDAGIGAKLIPTPRHLSSDCGVCARIERDSREGIEEILRDGRVEVAAIHDS